METPAPKPFKSALAAKFAYKKAEKAYETARQVTNEYAGKCRETGWCKESFAERARLEAIETAAYEAMEAVYKKACAEKHYVKSWHCGPNPTRDLIRANID